jgi:hypothetical protein
MKQNFSPLNIVDVFAGLAFSDVPFCCCTNEVHVVRWILAYICTIL